MCGFTAIFSLQGKKESYETLKIMTDAISHRGPDDEGYCIINNDGIKEIRKNSGSYSPYCERVNLDDDSAFSLSGQILLGFRRLSIVDLSDAGHQPMSYVNRYWIVFNGEIFNYKELRQELIVKGYQFSSETDTEVILAAYDCFGVDCFPKFNGMWAFVIVDLFKKNIIVSRDRFGKKPLYYFMDNEFLIFASEIKSIHKAARSSKIVDLEQVDQFLQNGDSSYSSDTVFKHVKRFPSSSYAIYNLTNLNFLDESIIKFWELPINQEQEFSLTKLKEYSEKFIGLLNDSVKLRMVADVKVGAALSGGLDSSTIVSLIVKNLNSKNILLETFSNIYPEKRDKDIDESNHIKTLIEYFGVKGNFTTPNPEIIFEEMRKMIYHSDLPTHSSNMSGWFTYKLAKASGITVILDGQGADEILAGYSTYFLYYLKDIKLSKLIGETRKIRDKFPHLNIVKSVALNLISNNNGKKLLNHLGKNTNIDFSLNAKLKYDLFHNMSNLLRYGDFLSMAHSIESRLPFLDYRLVEFLFQIPSNYKIHNGWTKYILRNSVQDTIPNSILWRKDKLGWPNADGFWFDMKYRDNVNAIIKRSKIIQQLLTNEQLTNLLLGNFTNYKMKAMNLAIWEDVNY